MSFLFICFLYNVAIGIKMEDTSVAVFNFEIKNLNTPVPVGTTLRCRRNSRQFEAGVPENKFPK